MTIFLSVPHLLLFWQYFGISCACFEIVKIIKVIGFSNDYSVSMLLNRVTKHRFADIGFYMAGGAVVSAPL